MNGTSGGSAVTTQLGWLDTDVTASVSVFAWALLSSGQCICCVPVERCKEPSQVVYGIVGLVLFKKRAKVVTVRQ